MQLDVFQTLADPTRRRIVGGLHDERAVNEMLAPAGRPQSGVSRHLRILNEGGFVQVRPVGPKRLYSLRPEPFNELDRWVGSYRDIWEARLERFAAALEGVQG